MVMLVMIIKIKTYTKTIMMTVWYCCKEHKVNQKALHENNTFSTIAMQAFF